MAEMLKGFNALIDYFKPKRETLHGTLEVWTRWGGGQEGRQGTKETVLWSGVFICQDRYIVTYH